jgi:polyhydroxyalkanoate synthesis regulator protein
LIGFYGDSLQSVVPQYLEHSMKSFSQNQERMRDYMQSTFGFNPFAQFEEVGKQNVAMLERAMKMFTPFAPPGGESKAAGDKPPADHQTIDELKRKLDELQSRLNEIGKPDSK